MIFNKTIQSIMLTLAVSGFLMVTGPAYAEVVLTTSTEYYSIAGKNQKDLITNLKKNSPINQDGKTYYATTQSKVRYEFSWMKRGNACTMKKATVFLHITYKYPRLTGKQSPTLLKWWDTHLKELEEHERVHGEIAKDGAAILNEKLNSINKISCSDTEKSIKKIADAILTQTRKTQANYDKLTDHGLKQSRYRGR